MSPGGGRKAWGGGGGDGDPDPGGGGRGWDACGCGEVEEGVEFVGGVGELVSSLSSSSKLMILAPGGGATCGDVFLP